MSPLGRRLAGRVDVHVAPYDGGSRTDGAANGAHALRALLQPATSLEYARVRSDVMGEMLSSRIGRSARSPLVLGGDHTLSFFAVRGLARRYPSFNIVHFDAHHDRYSEPTLNHYTVFHHVLRLFPVRVFGVGHRYDVTAPIPAELRETVSGPTYISVDVDYFPPSLVPSVTAPVPCASECETSLATFAGSLDKIGGPVIGCDVVEWHGSEVAAECAAMSAIVGHLVRVLER